MALISKDILIESQKNSEFPVPLTLGVKFIYVILSVFLKGFLGYSM